MSNKTRKNQLGGLVSEAQMEVHSSETARLWSPRKGSKAPTMGQFFKHVATLELAAKQDDPYADFALLEIEQKMNEAFTLYTEQMAQLPALVSSRIRFSEAQSRQPLTKALHVRSRFGWRMVSLLEMYDVLMVRLVDAQFKAQLSRQQFETQKHASVKKMHGLLSYSMSLPHSGITRQDVAANNAKAMEAHDKFGAIPLEVMEGIERAEFAPEIRVG